MKNFYKVVCLLMLASVSINGQEQVGIIGSNNWLRNWTEFSPKNVNYAESTHILAGEIKEDLMLSKKNTYTLLGNVFVTNGAILSIEPGTVILGDAKTHGSLTITKGSAIIAEGTETDPIIFTSSASTKKAGDWGGLIILGQAPTNKLGNSSVSTLYADIKPADMEKTNFGGDNKDDNSGVLKYVRVEYAGKKFNRYMHSNAIMLAALGNKTEINNVMVSYSAGNSFNIIGGAIDMHSMVSYKSKGNDYKFNYGAQSNIHNSLAVRSPYISSRSGVRCLMATSYDKEAEVDFSKKGTNIYAKNITFLTDSKSLDSDIKMGLVKDAVFVGNTTNLEINSSVISGFKAAVIIDEKTLVNDENLNKIKLSNMLLNNCKGNVFVQDNYNNQKLETWYGNPVYSNAFEKNNHEDVFVKLDTSRPDYRLQSNTSLALNSSKK